MHKLMLQYLIKLYTVKLWLGLLKMRQYMSNFSEYKRLVAKYIKKDIKTAKMDWNYKRLWKKPYIIILLDLYNTS